MRYTALIFGLTLSTAVMGQPLRNGTLPLQGKQLPDVKAWDAEGREFSLSELRGEYSVLVFGCLT